MSRAAADVICDPQPGWEHATMLRPTEAKAEEARKKARELFTRDRAKDEELVKEREMAFAAQSQKTARLRALRLAREEGEAAALAANPPAPKKTAAKKTAAKKATAAKAD